MGVFVGIDVGSVSLNVVVIDGGGAVVHRTYVRTGGRPVDAAVKAFAGLAAEMPDVVFEGASVTGSGKELISAATGIPVINEIVAHATGAWTVRPDVASIIEIGGQDSKFIEVGRDRAGRHFLADHAFNELCAAGTGAFLDQQAARLGLDLDTFGELAFSAPRPARLSGRCSVFAKSDMIHLQQKATPIGEIAAGLCFALARNYIAALCRGRNPVPLVLFQGGVASNRGVVKAFRELLNLDETQLVVPENHDVMGAFGAAVTAAEQQTGLGMTAAAFADRLAQRCSAGHAESGIGALIRPASPTADESICAAGCSHPGRYLGLDIGSVSTKAVIIDEEGHCLAQSYVPTAGRPVDAMRSAFRELLLSGQSPVVDNVCCTGSGRYLASALAGGGAVVDEITAQARGAAYFFPDVDTIIEIGGQDSKYIRLKNGRIERFQMNRACAAGTGAFLEEQCGRLGIDVRRDFSDLAFKSRNPARLGSRCTVFMDSDLVHHVQRGVDTSDICAGLACSIGQNYLEKVVGSRPVGDKVLFQGGVARNDAVRAVFNRLLEREVVRHPMPEVSGAFGAALTARAAGRTFRFDISSAVIEASSDTFECRKCSNLCEIRRTTLPGGRKAYFGSVCGRFEHDGLEPVPADDAFVTRERLLFSHAGLKPFIDGATSSAEQIVDAGGAERPKPGLRPDRGVVGIPFALSMSDYLPFWNTFLTSLGYSTELSGPSCRDVVEWGLAHVPAEFCYPMKVLFGHVNALLSRGVNRIFIPHLRLFTPPAESTARYACPYTQAAPYVVRENTEAEVMCLEYPVDGETDWWIDETARILGIGRPEVAAAFARASAAQAGFVRDCRTAGQKLIDRLKSDGRRGCVILGRPYNTTDRYVNLNLARRLSTLGIEPIPYDFMPLGDDPLPSLWGRVRWGYGRKLIQAARVLKHHPNLGAVILTNFGCGPDSFVDQYLEYELSDSPHIVLEMDDHQAEAGLVTRLEAFAGTFDVVPGGRGFVPVTGAPPGEPTRPLREYTYYIPHFSDHAWAFTGALKASGCRVVMLPPSDDESWEIGMRYAYGRECHPFVSFVGDIMKAAARPDFVSGEAAFFVPSYFGPCLLPQYLVALNLILQRNGLGNVSVINISDPPTMKELGNGYVLKMAGGIYAIDRLFKWKTEIQPYEANPGEVESVHQANVREIESALVNGGFFKTLRACVRRMQNIPLRPDRGRPVIGIVGDVYTRINEHANDRLYARLSDMGFEVWTSCSLIDVSVLGGEQLHRELERRGKGAAAFAARAAIPGAKAALAMVDRCFPDTIRTPQERHFPDVERVSSRYASYWIDKALSMNLNRVEEFHGAGAAGVVNVMCHNCMLGTVTAALTKSLRRDMDDMPFCNLVFEGLKSTHSTNRLEAFAHQVMSRNELK